MDKGNPLNQWEVDKWQVRDKSGINKNKKELSSPNGGKENGFLDRESEISL